jgi:nitroimidazol reductase NimA-like FMN-containing flavoprotein (pyridoxamine 5'-phosphate oxidase superfamily)
MVSILAGRERGGKSFQPRPQSEVIFMKWNKAKQLKFIAEAPVIRVATVNNACKPQVTPVCQVVWKDKIYWASDLDTTKLANIKKHRWVALVADVYKADWRSMGGVMVQGKARIIRGGPRFRAVRELLYKKYKVYRSNSPFEESEAVIIEVVPSRRFNWWYSGEENS